MGRIGLVCTVGLVALALTVASSSAWASTSIADNFDRVAPGASIVAPFTIPGTPVAGSYGRLVEVIVSGTGWSMGPAINDAFYGVPGGGMLSTVYYQLNVGWDGFPLAPYVGGSHNIDNFIVFIEGVGPVTPTARPAYNGTDHTYHFIINVPANAGTLTFGVSDGIFYDNGGQYNIEVHQLVPKVLAENVVAVPNPVPLTTGGNPTDVTLTALITEVPGISYVSAAQFSIDGGPSYAMSATDGAFDESVEDVEATLPLNLIGITEPGVYRVCVSGTEANGHTGDDACIMLVVYDPSAGFVTGGGWFYSYAGFYSDDPEAEGKASFGFVSRYQKGANVPTGNTEFQFSAGSLNFHSSEYDWLVVAGTKGKFKGTGTINGEGSYKFMITAGDGGSELPDTFRIQIWEEDAEGTQFVVYDNQPGDDPEADANTELGGGSIIVHSK